MDRGKQTMKYGKKRSAFLLAAVLMLTGLQMSGVTVKATAATPAVYTAEIKEDQTITAGQTVNLTVEMAAGTEKTYNSLNMVVSYDSNYLTFVKESSTGVAGCSFTETTSGVVDVARYGAAISLTTDKQVAKDLTIVTELRKFLSRHNKLPFTVRYWDGMDVTNFYSGKPW